MAIERAVVETQARGLANMGMSPGDKARLDELVRARMLRLNAMIQGLVTGLVAALAIFVATNWLVLKGGKVVGPHLGLLGQFFIGYEVTFTGSLIGAAYGFLCGFAIGAFVAKLYNWLVHLRESPRQGQA